MELYIVVFNSQCTASQCQGVWDTFVSRNSRYVLVRTSMYFSQTLVPVHTGTYRYQRYVLVHTILPDLVQGNRIPDVMAQTATQPASAQAPIWLGRTRMRRFGRSE